MQLPSSKSTTPLGARYSAEVGQTAMQGASSHWLQRITVNWRATSGKVPVSTYFTQVRLTPRGTSCSLLQATVQAWQPMQLPLSSRNPSRVIRGEPTATIAVAATFCGRRATSGGKGAEAGDTFNARWDSYASHALCA